MHLRHARDKEKEEDEEDEEDEEEEGKELTASTVVCIGMLSAGGRGSSKCCVYTVLTADVSMVRVHSLRLGNAQIA